MEWHRILALRAALNRKIADEHWRRAYILADALSEMLGDPEPRPRVVEFRR